jgi:hypothetical protein
VEVAVVAVPVAEDDPHAASIRAKPTKMRDRWDVRT